MTHYSATDLPSGLKSVVFELECRDGGLGFGNDKIDCIGGQYLCSQGVTMFLTNAKERTCMKIDTSSDELMRKEEILCSADGTDVKGRQLTCYVFAILVWLNYPATVLTNSVAKNKATEHRPLKHPVPSYNDLMGTGLDRRKRSFQMLEQT